MVDPDFFCWVSLAWTVLVTVATLLGRRGVPSPMDEKIPCNTESIIKDGIDVSLINCANHGSDIAIEQLDAEGKYERVLLYLSPLAARRLRRLLYKMPIGKDTEEEIQGDPIWSRRTRT